MVLTFFSRQDELVCYLVEGIESLLFFFGLVRGIQKYGTDNRLAPVRACQGGATSLPHIPARLSFL